MPQQLLGEIRIHVQKQIQDAQTILETITISNDFQFKISQICSELQIEGLRGDLVCTRAAKALTALENRQEVTLKDIQRTMTLCLRHRLRRDPMESIHSGEKIEAAFAKMFLSTQY